MARQCSGVTWSILIWMLFTSSWSKGQGKPLKCMHVWLHWCVTGPIICQNSLSMVSARNETFCSLLMCFDAFLQPFCSLFTAFLQPFCSLFAAFLQPLCSLSAASLQPFCSLFAAFLIIYFRAASRPFFFFWKYFVLHQKSCYYEKTSQLTVVLFKQKQID